MTKKSTNPFNGYKAKNSLVKTIQKNKKQNRFENNHNHVMLIIQKLVHWEQYHSLAFVNIVQYVIDNCLAFAANKQGTEFWTVCSCHKLRYKN